MHRDRPTLVSYAQLSAYGWFLYSFGATVTLLRDETGMSRTVASLHGTALSLGGIIVGVWAPAIFAAVGRGRAMRGASLLICVALLGYTSGGPGWLTIGSMLVGGIGGALLVTTCTAYLTEHAGPFAPTALAEANAGAAGLGFVGPLLVGAGVAAGIGWRPGLLVVVVLLVLVEFARGRSTTKYDTPESTTAQAQHAELPLPRGYWWALATLVCLVGVEFGLTLWAADLLRDRAGMGPAAASAALAALVGGMLIGRTTGAVVSRRVDPERLLGAAIGVCAVGFAFTWLSTSPLPALVGLVVTGCGAGLHWPLGITRAVVASGGQSNRATARASLGVGLASGIAPFVLAGLADHLGVSTAFAIVVPALLVTAWVALITRPVVHPTLV